MTTIAASVQRRDRQLGEHRHDPYRPSGKRPEPTVCPVCSAVYRKGRWQWAATWPEGVHWEICEACQRVKDDCPAGVLTLTGRFLAAHGPEIVRMAWNHEASAKADHPLERILRINEQPERVVIATTGIHVARRIADALAHAYKGTMESRYDEDGYRLDVSWHRDE